MPSSNIFENRTAGILLHPTSLPDSESCWGDDKQNAFGTLGQEAFNFIDFIAAAGLMVWQVLPLVPTENNLSPYQSYSVHAGNPDLISLDDLVKRGWIDQSSIQLQNKSRQGLAALRRNLAPVFYEYINGEAGAKTRQQFDKFIAAEASWLHDFALFSALRNNFNGSSWVDWPVELRKREPAALEQQKNELQDDIKNVYFEQFAFFSQWLDLKNYANEKGISVLGDIPIFVGHNSADVWAEPHYFSLDENGQPLTVAGVPPDAFSESGQRWGNPHYRWDVMAGDGFKWWLARFGTQKKLFNLIRIDHFLGFHTVYEIPGDKPDAREGTWIETPGDALLQACFDRYPDLKLVAENLGEIPPELEELRLKFNLPGMLVLHFAFESDDNPLQIHHHKEHNIVYTGTHDNNTTVGWFNNLSDEERKRFEQYDFNAEDSMPWYLMDMALASPAKLAIIPMQDFLALDGDSRMNMPGTPDKNWRWRFSWDQVDTGLAAEIKKRLVTYQRSVE